jgi:hypothetical protein
MDVCRRFAAPCIQVSDPNLETGGEGGIRTHGADNRTTAFETVIRNSDRHGRQSQFSVVAGLGFGPISGLLARNGPVFGIGGFEPPQPVLPNGPSSDRGWPVRLISNSELDHLRGLAHNFHLVSAGHHMLENSSSRGAAGLQTGRPVRRSGAENRKCRG